MLGCTFAPSLVSPLLWEVVDQDRPGGCAGIAARARAGSHKLFPFSFSHSGPCCGRGEYSSDKGQVAEPLGSLSCASPCARHHWAEQGQSLAAPALCSAGQRGMGARGSAQGCSVCSQNHLYSFKSGLFTNRNQTPAGLDPLTVLNHGVIIWDSAKFPCVENPL